MIEWIIGIVVFVIVPIVIGQAIGNLGTDTSSITEDSIHNPNKEQQ